MSLLPVIFRDIGEEVPASDRIVYAAFIRHTFDQPKPPLALMVMRAARDCGVSRRRAWQIVRKYNPSLEAVLDSDPSVV